LRSSSTIPEWPSPAPSLPSETAVVPEAHAGVEVDWPEVPAPLAAVVADDGDEVTVTVEVVVVVEAGAVLEVAAGVDAVVDELWLDPEPHPASAIAPSRKAAPNRHRRRDGITCRR
jgi:hypothetical protein